MNMDARAVDLVRQQALPNPIEHNTWSMIQLGKVNFSFYAVLNIFLKFRKIEG